jgi:uncharacterized protein YkwD
MPTHTFNTVRHTVPFLGPALVAARAACGNDVSLGLVYDPPAWHVTKETAWTAPQIAAVQTALDGLPDPTPQQRAQNEIDAWPLSLKAFALALVDQINVLRQAAGMQTVTPAQALAAIRQKAGTL